MSLWVGIDWSEKKHQVVFVNATGAVVAQLAIPHSLEGSSDWTGLASRWV